MTRTAKNWLFASLCPALMLGGCAASSDKYPSLAVRDFERTAEMQPMPAPPIVAPAIPIKLSGSALASLNSARDAANRDHAAFLNALPSTRRKVAAARGSGPSSNGWAEAQIALADLISRRSQTATALADIDALIVDAAIAAKGADYPREIQRQVAEMLARQDRSIANLKAGI